MESFGITNFKGIGSLSSEKLPLSSNNRTCSLLLYGENGVGKTTISEAIRLAKYYPILEDEMIQANIVGAERDAERNNWLLTFPNDPTNATFSIEVGDSVFCSTSHPIQPIISDDVYIFDRKMLKSTDAIILTNLMVESSFAFHTPKNELLSDEIVDMVLDDINTTLKEDFLEEIELSRSQNVSNAIAIKDLKTEESKDSGIDSRFNEAKQNLVKILLFLKFTHLDRERSGATNTLVVLDDIVTSLDISNRVVLTNYMLRQFSDCQIIIMTHSAGFFNLMHHQISVLNQTNQWKSCALHLLSDRHEVLVYGQDTICKSDSFRARLQKSQGLTDAVLLNEMRQHLECLLHEFAKNLIIGAHEESKDILLKLESEPENIYFAADSDGRILTIYDMVKTMKNYVRNSSEDTLKCKLERLIQKFDTSNQVSYLADVIRKVDTYQKVVLHPGSHAQQGPQYAITGKEIQLTLHLMSKLESILTRPNTRYPNGI